MSRPNIIWIFPDSWRHDAFGYRGNQVIKTPNIDKLADRGVTFTRAHCESPVCQPSRASLITGQYPSRHGLLDNEQNPQWGQGEFPEPSQPNVFHAFQAAGYHTSLIGKAHFAQKRRGNGVEEYGFDESWEEFDKYVLWRYDTPYTRYLKELGLFEDWSSYVRSLMPWHVVGGKVQPNPDHVPGAPRAAPDPVVPSEHQLDAFLGRQASDFIEQYARDEPFFLWFAPVGPHSPWDAPSDVSDRFSPEEIPLGPQGFDGFPDNRWGQYLRWNYRHTRCDELTDEMIRSIGKHYYGLCSVVDDAVGRLLGALEGAGRDRETWIFFSSDHGELLGDHGHTSKRVFYESSVLVPQIIVPPEGLDSGLEVGVKTQGFDLVGSMLDAGGVSWAGNGFEAESLLPALEGQDVGRSVVYSEIAGFLMVATDEHKVVIHKASGEVGAHYDLRNDPEERLNLAEGKEGGSIPAHMLELAEEHVARHGRQR